LFWRFDFNLSSFVTFLLMFIYYYLFIILYIVMYSFNNIFYFIFYIFEIWNIWFFFIYYIYYLVYYIFILIVIIKYNLSVLLMLCYMNWLNIFLIWFGFILLFELLWKRSFNSNCIILSLFISNSLVYILISFSLVRYFVN